MSKIIASSLFISATFLAFLAQAAPSPILTKPGKFSPPLRAGAVIGGQADQEFSLIGVESKTIKQGERITIAYGDFAGRPVKGQPGFFHAVIDRESKRVVIDLSQVSKTRIDAAALRKVFARSKFVSSTDMTMDPHDGSTNITLELKSPVVLLATTDPRKNGQVVLELRPVAGVRR